MGEHEADPMVDAAGHLERPRGEQHEGHAELDERHAELDERHAELAERLSRRWRGRALRRPARRAGKHRADDSWLEEISASGEGAPRHQPADAAEPAGAAPSRRPEEDARRIMAAAGRLAQAAGSVFARPDTWESPGARAWLADTAGQLDKLAPARSSDPAAPGGPDAGQPRPAEASTSSMGATAPA